MKRFSEGLPFIPILVLWAVLVIPFILRTPDESYSHDYLSHLQYSQFLQEQHRFPYPGEGGEGHQPPLYYLIASQLGYGTPAHARCVRLFAMVMGASMLGLLYLTLRSLGIRTLVSLVTLSFLATTPHFVFMFSSYNNDVLVIACAIALWAAFLRYVQTPSISLAIAMGVFTLAGFFSKFSFGAAAVSVGMAALYLLWKQRWPRTVFWRYLIPQILAILPVLLWMYFRNVKASGEWMALNKLSVAWQALPYSSLRTILTPPGLNNWEWMTPFADAFLPVGKKGSMTAYAFVTSVFGEYTFRQIGDAWLWGILWLHALWGIAGLFQINRTRVTRLMGIAGAAGWLSIAFYVLTRPYGSNMDFRHVAWVWLPLTVLQAYALDQFLQYTTRTKKGIVLGLIGLGILVQWALISAL